MKKIILDIRNNGVDSHKITLFGFKEEKDLPNHVSTFVKIIEDGKESRSDISYGDLSRHVNYKPDIVFVSKSTDNRRLDFFSLDIIGTERPCEPTLNSKGHPRAQKRVKCTDGINKWHEYEYRTPWNPKKWNIADAHEQFILSNRMLIKLYLKPEETFRIEFQLAENKRVIPHHITGGELPLHMDFTDEPHIDNF